MEQDLDCVGVSIVRPKSDQHYQYSNHATRFADVIQGSIPTSGVPKVYPAVQCRRLVEDKLFPFTSSRYRTLNYS